MLGSMSHDTTGKFTLSLLKYTDNEPEIWEITNILFILEHMPFCIYGILLFSIKDIYSFWPAEFDDSFIHALGLLVQELLSETRENCKKQLYLYSFLHGTGTIFKFNIMNHDRI